MNPSALCLLPSAFFPLLLSLSPPTLAQPAPSPHHQLQQAQTSLHQGDSQHAIKLAQQILHTTPNPQLQAIALGIIGNAYFLQGKFSQATDTYQTSLDIAQTLNNPELLTTAYNNLFTTWTNRYQRALSQAQAAQDAGNPHLSQTHLQQAIEAQTQAQTAAENALQTSQHLTSLVAAQARINILSILPPDAQPSYRHQAQQILTTLPPSTGKIYQLLSLEPGNPHLIQTALTTAQHLGEPRPLSFAWGELGKLHLQQQNYPRALQSLQTASHFAHQAAANDSLYQWQSLIARIYHQQGKRHLAKTHYRAAIASLQTLRQDIAQPLQPDFHHSVEPIYLNFLELLLEEDNPTDIQEALEITDLLQIALLENFFGEICWTTQTVSPQTLSQQTQSALITLLPLPHHVYLILQLPDGTLSRHRLAITPSQLHSQLTEWRHLLEQIAHNRYLTLSQTLYTQLIAPIDAHLDETVKTLVFNPVGQFRTVPLAALHDGKQFLVEKYAVAHTLTWRLQSRHHPNPSPALIFGLSQGGPNTTPLPGVHQETHAIQTLLGGHLFLNQDFTPQTLENALKQHPAAILHLASHAKFGGTPESSFIQTASQPISLPEFETILNRAKYPPSLLVLSACQTAAGSELGLAGISLRTGVTTVMGSLWFTSDRLSAELLNDFYHYNQTHPRAQALALAQIQQIRDPRSHPATWAPLTLWGYWH